MIDRHFTLGVGVGLIVNQIGLPLDGAIGQFHTIALTLCTTVHRTILGKREDSAILESLGQFVQREA